MHFKALRSQIASAFESYSRALFWASKFVKVVLIIGGAAVAAIALSIDIAHAAGEVSPWTIAGIAGASLVAVGSIFDAIKERDAAPALVLAAQAINAADERQAELNEFVQENGRFDRAVTRGLNLYSALDVMRGAIEQSLDLGGVPIGNVVQTCLDAANTSLLGAFDFAVTDIWTICIFMAQATAESGKMELRCIAHLRKIPCDITDARVWKEGVGVAGIAYSMNKEIIIEDMSSQGHLFMGAQSRSYDEQRYASMVAVPITVGKNPKPWGVAVVTSDRLGHFERGPSYGISTAEPIRAIAGMTALAVKAVERHP